MIQLQLTKSTLRSLKHTDAESIARQGNHPYIANNMRDMFPHPYTTQLAEKWIKNNLLPENEDWIQAIEVNGEAVGVISILFKNDIFRLSAEIGYWIGESYWGKGIMTEAVKAVTEYTLDNTDLVRIYGVVFQNNKASAAVLENAGYRFEGTQRKAIVKNNEVIDALIYATIK